MSKRIWIMQRVCNLMKFDCNQSWLLSLPLYHVSGQGIVWRWLYCGAQLHFPKDDFMLHY